MKWFFGCGCRSVGCAKAQIRGLEHHFHLQQCYLLMIWSKRQKVACFNRKKWPKRGNKRFNFCRIGRKFLYIWLNISNRHSHRPETICDKICDPGGNLATTFHFTWHRSVTNEHILSQLWRRGGKYKAIKFINCFWRKCFFDLTKVFANSCNDELSRAISNNILLAISCNIFATFRD